MNKYKEIISKLKVKGIYFEKGLSEDEVNKIEKYYDIFFPMELKKFYLTELPVSEGFYNWRDMEEKNIKNIEAALKRPLEGLMYDIKYNDFWCEKWGEKPENIERSQKVLLEYYSKAPKMIPIYSHRYMPFISKIEEIPVFSLMQSDIIYYGFDLISYFEIEFGIKKYSELLYHNFEYVDFWSDM